MIEARSPRFNAFGTIDLEINDQVFGWIPFTAAPSDQEDHGREIYARAMAGEYGPVAAYIHSEPTEAEKAAVARIKRDSLLAATDWTQLPDVPDSTRAKWASYRQALRDVPEQIGFPSEITWPTSP